MSRTATAESPASTEPPATPKLTQAGTERARLAHDLEAAPPPPSGVAYFQYGVAFATELILSPGPICNNSSVPCILGPGGGIVFRAGWRSTDRLYLGGAYEFTKQDPNKLYRLALLQQVRAEARYYLMTARVTEPYAAIGFGVVGYGNEWAIDTWGPTGSIGGGTVVGIAMSYRLLSFSGFTDTAGSAREGGIAQLLGLDLVLEQRDAILRDGAQ